MIDETTKNYIDEQFSNLRQWLEQILHEKFIAVQVDSIIHAENVQRQTGECMDAIINAMHERANQAIMHADSNTYDIARNIDNTRECLANCLIDRTDTILNKFPRGGGPIKAGGAING